MNPVRNFSPAIAGLETERGIISNGVNLSAEFNATTGFTLKETTLHSHICELNVLNGSYHSDDVIHNTAALNL